MSREDIVALKESFAGCSKVLDALASKVRQEIILQLASVYPNGLRVNEIKMSKCITRPTMSHHIKLLFKAGLLDCKRVGTKNYYTLSTSIAQINLIQELLDRMKEFSHDSSN
ncbi:MAG: winged helix-turn-helix domain-containing protein [Anaeroplasmataceae bacterium]|nr:winged helix-turn-helix domain-containing protein [Anaeroplasmataceae bacterium]